MAIRKGVSPTLNGEGAVSRKTTPSIALLGGSEHLEATENALPRQDEARRCEGIARRHALAALLLGGGMALQEAALSRHYSGRAVNLMRGAQQ